MSDFTQNRLILISNTAAAIINIIIWILFARKFGLSVEPVPLHFNVVLGIDKVGPAYLNYQIPIAGLVVWLINFFLGRYLYDRERLLSYFLFVFNFFTQSILLISAVVILIINN